MAAPGTSHVSRAREPGDLSARTVWFVMIALYAVMMGVAWFFPAILQGPRDNWELGLMESVQNLTLLISLVLAVELLRHGGEALMRWWLVLIALALVFLLGEETSWGQHYFNWETGGWFAEVNDQGETNLHNTPGGWLDQKPRMLLQIGMIVGGVIHPLMKLVRGGRGLIDSPWWLAPTIACMAPVLISLLAGAPKAIDKLAILPVQIQFYRASEMEECFMYFFFAVYLLSLRGRLLAQQRG